jgi:hypothetical protein
MKYSARLTYTAIGLMESYLRLIITSLVLICLNIFAVKSQSVYFNDSKPDTMIVGNSAYYEIGVNRSFGGILYIKDKSTGKNISLGSPYGSMLWGIGLTNGSDIWSTSPQNIFSYEWTSSSNTLTLRYIQSETESKQVPVTVTIVVSNESYFDMQFSIANNYTDTIKSVSFPLNLGIPIDPNSSALLACDYPGVMLNSNYFKEKRSYIGTYPEFFHFDYISFQLENSILAFYTLRDQIPVLYTSTGIANLNDPSNPNYLYAYVHDYSVWITHGKSFLSPITRIEIAKSFIETINDYRINNKIDLFPSLKEKLGTLYDSIIHSPYYMNAFGESTNLSFNDFPQLAKNIPSPGILMLSMYWPGSFHEHHPDYLPPKSTSGTMEDFSKMYINLQNAGYLVMPFTQPLWWHENSPTLQNLPAPLSIKDIAQIDEQGKPVYFSWELNGKVDWGYFVSPYHPFVQQRFDRMMQEMKKTVPSDLIYVDVIGAHGPAYDFNPTSPNPVSYCEGWLNLTKKYSNNLLIVESGYDRMFESVIGFMGTLKMPDYLKLSGNLNNWYWNSTFGLNNWEPYSFAPFVINDKVIPYQIWSVNTDNKETFSWNLLYGCMLNFGILGDNLLNGNPSWLNVTSDFQKEVVSRIAGKLMTNYTKISDKVLQSTFGDISVLSNEDTQFTYKSGKHTLSPEGVQVTSSNGDLVAGIFHGFNNEALTPGDHYLIVNTYRDSITIRQPMGVDTPIKIDRPSSWSDLSNINVYAVGKDIYYKVPKSVDINGIHFNWQRSTSQNTVLYYILTYGILTAVEKTKDSLSEEMKLFQIYPNPNTGNFKIIIPEARSSEYVIKIINVMGQTQYFKTVYPRGQYYEEQLNVPNLSKGIYFIKVSDKRRESFEKIVIN